MTVRLRPSRRLVSVAVAIGLLGGCAALIAGVDSPGTSSVALRQRPAPRPHGPAPAATTPAARTGLRLMDEAAAACNSMAFHGTQIVDWWGSGDGSASVIQVWHRPGSGFVTQPSSTAGAAPAEHQLDPDALLDQAEVMTITPQSLTLMRANYDIAYAGRGTVDGRRAQLVEVRRRDGSLAARFWLDAATGLPLRRELVQGNAQIFSEDAFVGLSVGTSQLRGMPAADAQPWTTRVTSAAGAALRAQGWPLPRAAAGGLTLFKATETPTKTGKVIELSYSDGLSVISVFVQRGQLPNRLPGWRRITARGSQVYAVDPDDRSLAWAAHGFVYTVISDAPAGTVDQVITLLPHDSQPGFWERMARGLRRIASWANPFG